MHTKNTQKNFCDLEPWPSTLKFNKVLEAVEVHVSAKFHQAKCMSYQRCTRFRRTLRLRSLISLERIKQSTSKKRRYQLRLFLRLTKKSCKLRSTNKKWPWPLTDDLKFSRIRAFVQNFIKLSAAVHELSRSQRKNSDENNTVGRYRGH